MAPTLELRESDCQYGRKFIESTPLRSAGMILGLNTGGGNRWQYKKWTFEGYVGFIELIRKRHAGVGIMLGPVHGWLCLCSIDLDTCIDGEIAPTG